MSIFDEERLQEAIRDYKQAKYQSIRAAAKAHVPSYATVQRRYRGTQTPRRVAREARQWLSNEQEAMTRDWILSCERVGYLFSYKQFREFVGVLASSSTGGRAHIGQNWVTRVLRRHPNLIGKKIKFTRVNNTSLANIKA
jgi:hypothetical protein